MRLIFFLLLFSFCQGFCSYLDVAALSQNDAIVVGTDGLILKTTDGGDTWIAIPSGASDSLFSMHFIGPDSGWLAGGGGTILRTTDGGGQWESLNSGVTSNLRSIFRAPLEISLFGGT